MWKQETATEQMSQAVYSSSPLSLCTVTPICRLARRLGGGKRIIGIFICTFRNDVMGGREGPTHTLPRSSGGQMNADKGLGPLEALRTQAGTDSPEASSSLRPVSKTDEAVVPGLGAFGLPAGTSRPAWYIRSRSQLTCHSGERWDGAEGLQRFLRPSNVKQPSREPANE